MSLRDDILAVKDNKVLALEIPEWGKTIFLRVLTGRERDAFEESCQAHPKTGIKSLANFRARFAAVVLCDQSGDRIFSDGDAALLGQKSATSLDRILEAGLKHNAMSGEDVENLAGKLPSGQSSDSGTASP